MFMLMMSDYVFTCLDKVVTSQSKCFLSCVDQSFNCGVFGFQIGAGEVKRKVGVTLIH